MRRLLALIVCACVLPQPASAHGSVWPVRRRSPPAAGYFALAWRAPLVRHGMYRVVPRSFGAAALSPQHNSAVVGTGDGWVHGFSLDDGSRLWSRPGGDAFETHASMVRAAPGDTYALLGSRTGSLLALDPATGAQRFAVQLDADVRAPALQVGDALYLTTAANRVVALSSKTGAQLWTAGRAPPTGLSVAGHAAPLVVDDTVYAGFSDGSFMAFDKTHGTSRWQRMLGGEGPFLDVDTDAQVLGDQVFAASSAGGIYALSRADGSTVWHRPIRGIVALVRHHSTLLAASGQGTLWGLDAATGTALWQTQLGRGPLSRMALWGHHVLLSAGEAGLVVVDARNGRPAQAAPLGESRLGDPSLEQGGAAVVGASGQLYFFTARAQPHDRS